MEAKDIHKEMLPMYVNIVCHVRQSIIGCRSSRKGGQLSKTNTEPVGRWRSPRRKRCSSSKTSSEQRGGSPSTLLQPLLVVNVARLTTRCISCFPDNDAVERDVRAWFREQPKEFYAAGFQGLVKRWDKCLNLYGDSVEKQMLFVCHYLHSILFNHDL